MMDSQGFDAWAENYDDTVVRSNSVGEYPFAAYTEVLDEVYQQVRQAPGLSILDMGFGTGTLTARFYAEGFEITGIDFSTEMLAKAKVKMPQAKLYHAGFSELPTDIFNWKYSSIIFTYSIHHLGYNQQYSLIKQLVPLLEEGGAVVIGDVMTATTEDMALARKRDSEQWDDEEFYPVVQTFQDAFPQMTVGFIRKSYCSGVLVMRVKQTVKPEENKPRNDG